MAYKESLSYDKTDPISIYEYALPLIDHTLREIVGDAAVAGYNSKNKGELGQMVEELYYHCLGSIPELFDGNPPFHGRGAISFAANVAGILRAIRLLDKH